MLKFPKREKQKIESRAAEAAIDAVEKDTAAEDRPLTKENPAAVKHLKVNRTEEDINF